MKNQDDNQLENQDDLFFNTNSSAFVDEEEKNIVCNIYKEQFDLINELPIEERMKVLYIAVSKAFYETEKNQVFQDENQLDNQDEKTYISISISIYNSISNYSKKLLKLLFKTINCKNYKSKNWGGKRENAGRKKQEQEPIQPIPENLEPVKSKTDPFSNPIVDKCFEIYKQECPDLLKLGFEPRTAKVREEVAKFLDEIDSDIGYFTELCRKANSLKEIVNKTIDFTMLIRNHIGIYNGKYKDNTFDITEYLKGSS